ncbi:MAG: DUF177 domain-containing protein [Tannerella sp.]|jgi:uncharacterized metal-binding protein YceD (DUF177 family)|nr:DUF177 domain-containing protein [Tannerella sp.]
MKTYQIDLKSISPTMIYEYDWTLQDDFFESVEATDVKRGRVRAFLDVIRVAQTFELTFRLEGEVTVMCDRCLDDVELPVVANNRLTVSFGEAYEEVSDEHIIVDAEDGIIDLAWIFYENIVLALPMKRVHEDGKCNEVMAQKLKELSVENNDKDSNIDPRWEDLLKVKN